VNERTVPLCVRVLERLEGSRFVAERQLQNRRGVRARRTGRRARVEEPSSDRPARLGEARCRVDFEPNRNRRSHEPSVDPEVSEGLPLLSRVGLGDDDALLGPGVIRLHRHDPTALPDRVVVPACIEVVPPGVCVDERRERVELLSTSDGGDGGLVTARGREEPGVPVVGHGEPRLELERFLESRLRFREVEVSIETKKSDGVLGFRQLGGELERPGRCSSRDAHRLFRGNRAEPRREVEGVGESRPRSRVARVELDRGGERSYRALESGGVHFGELVSSP
jgi:hypothetical protein